MLVEVRLLYQGDSIKHSRSANSKASLSLSCQKASVTRAAKAILNLASVIVKFFVTYASGGLSDSLMWRAAVRTSVSSRPGILHS